MPLKATFFLATSCITAIATVGCIFELTGSPKYGVVPTFIILLVSLPATFFLFSAAIKEGRAAQ